MTLRMAMNRITIMSKRQLQFSDQLRQAIQQSEKTRYRISQETGISEAVLSRFLHKKVGLSMTTIDLVCGCLKLRLAPENKPPRKKGR